MSEKNKKDELNGKGTWKKGDLRVVEIVYDGKVITPKKKPEDTKKKGKK